MLFQYLCFESKSNSHIGFQKENAKGSIRNVLLAFSQSYIKHNLRKNKIVVTSTTGFFRH
jgi:hypothetical protein